MNMLILNITTNNLIKKKQSTGSHDTQILEVNIRKNTFNISFICIKN